MNFSNQQQDQDETGIELTPLIDVVFLLLIFFMISTTFTKETSLKINLPDADQAATQIEQPQKIEIHISAESEFALANDGPAKVLINSNRDTLMQALREASVDSKSKANNNVLLVIRADKQAPHSAVIKVMDVAQQLGLSNLTFATQQAND